MKKNIYNNILLNLELKKRLFKYFVIFLTNIICLRYIPENYININEIISMSLTIATSFIILDTYTPSINYK